MSVMDFDFAVDFVSHVYIHAYLKTLLFPVTRDASEFSAFLQRMQ